MTPVEPLSACGRAVAATLLVAAIPASGRAQEPTPALLDRVVITATRSENAQLDVPASIDALTRQEVRDTELRINLSESLWRIPGVVAANRQNYAQDLQISIRGFGARSTFGVRGLRLYLDGIPATQPDGSGQVSHFPLNAVETIEVLRGPFSALYGSSSGGVIAMSTRLAPQPLEVDAGVAVGSFGTWRASLAAMGGTFPYAASLDATAFSTDGYREHSAATRNVLNVRAAALDTPIGRVRLTLNSLDMPAEDPLGLTRAQWEADPQQASPVALLFNTRKTTRQTQFGAEFSGDAWAQTTYQAIAWFGQRTVEQYQAIPVATQTPANHPGGVIDFDRNYGGIDARLQTRFGSALATIGFDYERLNESRQGYENFVLAPLPILGVRGRLRRDESNVVQSTDAYAQIEAELSEVWRVLAGVRASRVTFEGDDHFLANGNDSGSADYSGVNPTVGVTWRFNPMASLYAAYGRGFETPTLNELAYRPNGTAGFNTNLSSAESSNIEVGAKLATPTLRGAVAIFETKTTDDLVVLTNAGGRSTFGNAASTRRRGGEVGITWLPIPALTVDVVATAIQATFDSPFLTCVSAPCTVPTVPVAQGNRLPGIPAYTGAVAGTYRSPWADLTLEWRAQSKVYVDDRNTDNAPGYGVVNAAVARTFNVGTTQIRAFFRVDNVLDARYIGSVIVNEANGRYFEPAPGRQWLVGLDVGFR